MHILTLVVSFTYSIPRFQWPRVMVELLEVTATRRLTQATVLFRDEVYEDGLMSAFMDHVSRWRHVLSDVCHYIGGYRAPPVTTPESWNAESDSYAASSTIGGCGECDATVVAVAYTIAHHTRFPLPSQRSHRSRGTAPSPRIGSAPNRLG